jgi:hypothetical protein
MREKNQNHLHKLSSITNEGSVVYCVQILADQNLTNATIEVKYVLRVELYMLL